ncbi:MAG TPA: GNAT family N-acetyltransferase [Bacillota bacterium]|nr:GNAT family N-acetyltransferase [Bacillota bacterium]
MAYANALSIYSVVPKGQMAVENFSIRKATEDDIPIIGHLAEVIWADTYKGIISEEEQRLILDDSYSGESLKRSISENVFLVAEDGGQPIGFVDMGVCAAVLYLHRLYVLPSMQKRGVGKRLLLEAISHSMVRFSWHLDGVEGPQAVVATVDTRNQNARAAYAKMGFEEEYETWLPMGGIVTRVTYIVKVLTHESQL